MALLWRRRADEDRDTAAVVSGSKDSATTFTETWTLALDGPDEAPWRLVSAAGIAVLIGIAAFGAGDLGPFDAEFWVLAALVLIGELFPIQVHGQVGEETFSTPFAFALLLSYGITEVVVVQVAASLAAAS